MYTECTIQWVDDGSMMDVIIKANDSFDKNDDRIFFYGLSRQELLKLCKSGETCEGEWKVIAVGKTWDRID